MRARRAPFLLAPSLLAVLAFAMGCQRPIPGLGPEAPPPPPPPPAVEPPPPPPPPPAPKCEALEEGCSGGNGARARVGASGLDFAVPKDWKYAQAPNLTLATTATGAFVIGAADKVDEKDKKKDPKAADPRDVLLLQAAEKASLVLPKKKGFFARKPDRVDTFGDLKLSLFQLEGVKRDTQKGSLLMFTGDLPDGKASIVGLGFVADDDKANSDEAIMDALRSLAHGAAPAAPSSEAGQPAAAPARPSSSAAPAASTSAP